MLRLAQNTGARSQAGRRSLVCRLKGKPAGKCNADEGVAASVMLPDRNSSSGWPRMQSKVMSDWNQLCGWALKSLLWEGKEDRERKWLSPSPSLSRADDLRVCFVQFGENWDREWFYFQHKYDPQLQLGEVQRGQMTCRRFPLQDSSRAGNKMKLPSVFLLPHMRIACQKVIITSYVALGRSNLWQLWIWNMRSPPLRYSITKKRFS